MISFLVTLFQLVASIGYGHPDYVKAYDETAGREIHRLFAKEGLAIFGSGGAFPDRISEPSYYVFSSKKMEEEEAVEYFQKIFKQMLMSINNSKEIRFYLFEYPLTDQSLSLWIKFGEKYPKPYHYPAVSDIFNAPGKIIVKFVMDDSSQSEKRVEIPFEIKLSK